MSVASSVFTFTKLSIVMIFLFTLLLLPFNAFLLSMKPHNFPPAIPSSSLVPVNGQRLFQIQDDSAVDLFARRVVSHFRRSSKIELEGQVKLEDGR